jgi:Peptidase_C39 like family
MKKLKFSIQDQEQYLWCWAAVSVSVSKYYSKSSEWTQCRVANAVFQENNPSDLGDGIRDCCNNPGKCNRAEKLEYALKCTQNYVGKSHVDGSSDAEFPKDLFQQVCDEIDNEKPVAALIKWSEGGGHYVVIFGYEFAAGDPESPYFWVRDPYFEIHSRMPVSEFFSEYYGDGRWTDTYFTRGDM